MSDVKCYECDGPMPADYDPAYCCNSFDCGCMGQPTNPPFCSEACWEKRLAKMRAPSASPALDETPPFPTTGDSNG